MELDEMIFLGACSLLRLQAMTTEDSGVVITKPQGYEIDAAVTVAQRVWKAVCDE